MKHLFKLQSMDALETANKVLLGSIAASTTCSLILAAVVGFSEEKWVLVPTYNTEKRLSVSASILSESYLREWAEWVTRVVLTTSADTVERQLQEVADVSTSTKGMETFFKRHTNFIKGSRIESVFFPKTFEFEKGAVFVSGSLRYWLGGQEKPVTQDKKYRLSYRRAQHGVLLLSGFEDLEGE